MSNVVEATILTGPFKGEDVLIPHIPKIPTDMPFQFKRLQFPIRLAFAITLNKAQGQSLELCGLDLDTDCFSHGQLYVAPALHPPSQTGFGYVACSRVGKPDNLCICTDNGTTKKYCIPTTIPRRERHLRDPGYLQDSASSLGDTHRSPVDGVRPPPPDPDVETWAPAQARAPPPPGTRTLALPEGSQQQPRGRHVGPEAAPAGSGTPRGACAAGASKASSPVPGFRVAQRLGPGGTGTSYRFTEGPRRRVPLGQLQPGGPWRGG
ncbi:hypothetical protein QTO34_010534 [Cnephaeus nilssonii]|uniref:Uncharacterized protein n=1 Tax=Cnephaeus nilssonii TaxID=3371016 RepID=A0AA40LEX5_CNENI|nr:hypothetical protein QTO34_010534 [Eptesicus nilssonii]